MFYVQILESHVEYANQDKMQKTPKVVKSDVMIWLAPSALQAEVASFNSGLSNKNIVDTFIIKI